MSFSTDCTHVIVLTVDIGKHITVSEISLILPRGATKLVAETPAGSVVEKVIHVVSLYIWLSS